MFLWGDNTSFQLGPFECASWETPACISEVEERASGYLHGRAPTSIAAGATNSAVVTDTGKVAVWGRGDNGNLGVGDSESVVRVPEVVERLMDHEVKQVSLGWRHSGCVTSAYMLRKTVRLSYLRSRFRILLGDGRCFMWGQNDCHQLGLGEQVDQPEPMPGLDPSFHSGMLLLDF